MNGPFRHLQPGRTYDLVEGFTDYDGAFIPPSPGWRYVGHNFLPYEDGLTLRFATPDTPDRHVRLQWRDESQGAIIEALERYFVASTPGR